MAQNEVYAWVESHRIKVEPPNRCGLISTSAAEGPRN
jgi:hypothetical protein